MNNLTKDLSNVSISIIEYTVIQDLDTSQYDIGYFSTVSLNFYQLWAILGRDPVLHSGKCKYEWRIQSSEGVIFSIYDWNNSLPLLQTTQWHIGSTGTSVENKRFLKHLGKAMNCYNKYYKCMEEGIFESKKKNANECMQVLQNEIQSKLKQFEGI